MSDETELNPQLREGEAAIEAALRGVLLPESAIDHDQVMYRAGWAAALAEHGIAEEQQDATATIQTKRTAGTAGYWPALAMTFAATTAACLMVILLPPAENGSVAANSNESNRQETIVEIDQGALSSQGVANNVAKATQTKATLTASTNFAPQRFGMARLLGGFVEKVTADRNALFEKHLAEAASPSLAVFRISSDKRDFERPEPLTARSVISFSL